MKLVLVLGLIATFAGFSHSRPQSFEPGNPELLTPSLNPISPFPGSELEPVSRTKRLFFNPFHHLHHRDLGGYYNGGYGGHHHHHHGGHHYGGHGHFGGGYGHGHGGGHHYGHGHGGGHYGHGGHYGGHHHGGHHHH